MRNLSLRAKMTAVSVLVGFFVLALVIGFIAHRVFVSEETWATDNARQMVKISALQIEKRLTPVVAEMKMFAGSLGGMLEFSNQMANRDEVNSVIRSILNELPDLFSICVVMEPNAFDGKDSNFANVAPGHDKTGRFIPYWNKGSGQVALEPAMAYETDEYYSVPVKEGKVVITEPTSYIAGGKEQWMITLGVPVRAHGNIVGMTSTDFLLDYLSEVVSEFRPLGEGRIELITHRGNYAATYRANKLNQPADDLPAAVHQAMAEKKGIIYHNDETGFIHMVEPVTFEGSDIVWFTHTAFRQSLILEKAWQQVFQVIMVAAAGLALLGGILFWMIRRELRPLENLTQKIVTMSSAFAQGKSDLTERLPCDGSAEICEMSASLNTYVQHVQDLVATLKAESVALSRVGHTLTEGADQLYESSQQQLEAAQSTASAAEEISTSVILVAETAQSVGDRAESNFRLTASAGSEVDTTAREILTIHQTINDVQEGTQALADYSQQIESIVGVIHDIAEQTNLLALNAAIEAARAGDSGRGFAVVADEVRKLAERTAQATGEINGKIGSLTQQNQAIVTEVSSAVALVDSGSSMAQHANASIAEIEGNMKEMTEAIHSVVLAMNEQAKASQDITQHIESIRKMVEMAHGLLSDIKQSAHGLADQADRLSDRVSGFKV